MRMRITSLDEKQLNVCLKNSVWGSKTNALQKWENGDMLVFCVNKEIAAVANVSGTADASFIPIWDNGLFPWRIPLTFTHYFSPNNRIPFSGEIRDMFYYTYGMQYGYVFLNKMLLKSEIAEFIMNKIKLHHNNLPSVK